MLTAGIHILLNVFKILLQVIVEKLKTYGRFNEYIMDGSEFF